MKNVVEVKNVVKSFKDKIVLNHVSFSMKPGEIVGFVGQNGAGKSTLMKCMCNLINMDEGTISICEEDVVKQREKALSYVSCMIEGPGLFENMTGKENLELMATLNHASKEKLHEMMEFTQIGSQLKTKAVSHEGTISICEEDVVKQREKALSYVSCMIEGPGLFENMTGKENLELMATLNHASKEKLHEMMEFTQIGSQLKTKAVSQYSMGMKQRTGLAVALMKEPKVLLLDEPMNGLDATGIQGLREELIRLAKEKNVALLISSHQLGEIEKMADRIIGIHFGKIKEISMEEKENVYVLETDRKIPDQSDLQIIEQ
ncbi:ABC transporter ATP-binding protein, partial [Holdemanella biformis]